jgi:hypothetical protein
MTDTIPLPPLCLTLLPPWPQAILYTGKRLENRSAGVSAQIGGYRGLVGLSQSKAKSRKEQQAAISLALTALVRPAREGMNTAGYTTTITEEAQDVAGSIWDNAGKLFLVANLARVLRPHEARGNPWHAEGQHGLLFDKVWEVEPVNARGGQGAWKPYWCAQCGAISAAHKSMQCATCEAGHAYDNNGERPQLRIIREVSP